MEDTDLLIIGALAIYLLPKVSDTLGNINNTVDTVSNATNNVTSAGSTIIDYALTPLTGNTHDARDPYSIYTADYWTTLWNNIQTDWNNLGL